MATLGRNDACFCGSGKKYKKCCLSKEERSILDLYSEALRCVDSENPTCAATLPVYESVLSFVYKNSWHGACHATSAILYVLYKELGLNPTLCIGEIRFGALLTDHSWVEVDGKVHDVAIALTLDGRFVSTPVFAGVALGTLLKTEGVYGCTADLGSDARLIYSQSVADYLNKGAGDSTMNMWNIVLTLGREVGLNLDKGVLIDKYAKDKRFLKTDSAS